MQRCSLIVTFAPLTSKTAKGRQLYISHAWKDTTEWLNSCLILVQLWKSNFLFYCLCFASPNGSWLKHPISFPLPKSAPDILVFDVKGLGKCLSFGLFKVKIKQAIYIYIFFCVRDHNDRTALHIAAIRGSKRCVQYILQHHPKCINLFDKNQVSKSFVTVYR